MISRTIFGFAAALSVALALSAFHYKGHRGQKKKTQSPVVLDTAQAMMHAYAKLPLPITIAGQTVWGYQVDPQDFATIRSNAAGYQTLMLYFGVQNYAAALAGTQSPIYTLVVVPVKTDGTHDTVHIAEYVLPCPPYCPPGPPDSGK